MARQKVKNGRSKRDDDGAAKVRSVSSEALRGVCAIFFVATAGFLILSELGGGGALGEKLFAWLSWLLGVGYLLLPVSLILFAILIFRSFEKHIGWIHTISLIIFLVSGLGLINLAFEGRGGVLGSAISSPIASAIAVPATVIFLLAFVIASLVIAFDVNLGIVASWIKARFSRSEEGGGDEASQNVEDVPVTGLPAKDSEPVAEASAQAKVPEEKREGSISSFFSKSLAATGDPIADGFPIIAAIGSAYSPPPVSILAKNKGKPEVGDVKANMNIIKRTLQNFGIQVEMDEASIGPTVTRYAMKPAEGVRLSKIVALQSNLELALAASPVRIEAPIPGKSLVGVEVPNIARTTLGLAPLVSEEAFVQSDKPLLISLGRSITGTAHFADLARMPHLLVAGTTGAGKSVAIHDFIVSMLYRCGPERLRFIMVDILEAESVRDIASYHQNVVAPALERVAGDTPLPDAMPYIVVVIDELADIMSMYPRELEGGIVRLAQMSRAVGIHLILSTQRPSVKVITGLIKANIPARVAFQVASQIDSRTILDMSGAEKLLGAGDMLFLSGEMSKPRRIQAPFISENEVKRVVAHIARESEGQLTNEIDFTERGQSGGTDPIFSAMIDDSEDDELYGQAKQTVIEAGKASTSYLQRKLGIGYARAARLIDILEERGIIGPGDGAKPREVIGAGNADLSRRSEAEADELVNSAPPEEIDEEGL
ncbi:MAG: cell division FtsK/SpoIIIE [Candidatus Kaiserbacteria bacterium GW2011_GWA2_52_12]|uniref:Cell division FtsK/SpoIIIE n=1 Tax=Candidatus Kaiserbacteria bacterium GW2011_GWA2_52_12 TaxID=1618671 RepID=A0A0G1WX75_9BACT|nr:MAG: cell division FtsK/SpoIIIE [Candidatus Kaiserbacteria bacterium GW2011_GWA2_52_12]